VSYDLPSPSSRTAAAIFGGWSLDSFFFARSGTPFHVSVVRDIGFGSFSARPDLVPGASPWVEDGTAPGGKRLDRTAFVVPTELRQGNLPRNSIYGFAAWQLDMALRRTIPLGGKRRVQLRAEFFNVLNNPNFAQPNTTLTSGLFGVSAQMLGRSLGNVGASGLNPLYQIGGPRSAQLVARLMF
jgi:hypothetical protein